MVDKSEGTIEDEGGPLDGVQLSYWTSLCDDILNGRIFKNNEWRVRIRITAAVQMDLRLAYSVPNISGYGSPFEQTCLYDFSQSYGLVKRMPASVFTNQLPALSQDSTAVIVEHLQAIRKANQDASISGIFVLERLWLGDGSGRTDFAVGDGIEQITGRYYNLYAASDGGNVYPEIVQITYHPAEQRMELITRDLRFAQQVEIDKGT